GVDEAVGDSKVFQVLCDEVVSPAVQAILRQQMIARSEHGEQSSRDGSHTASRDQGSIGVFQRGQFLVEQFVVWRIVQPDIPNVVIAYLILVLKCRGLKNGGGDRPADARLWLSGVYQPSLDRLIGVRHFRTSVEGLKPEPYGQHRNKTSYR